MINAVPPEKVRAWEQLAVALLILGAVSAAASVVFALLPSAWWALRLPVSLAINATTVFLLVTGIVWSVQTRQIRAALRDDEGGRQFSNAWVLAIAVYVIGDCAVAKALGGPDPLHHALLLANAVRIVWIVIAMATLVAVRRDVRNVLTGKIRVGPATDDTIRYDVVPTARATAADDEFWGAAGTSAREAGAELALLETTHSLDRRWFLVPASGDLTDLRTQLTPGAVLTLFSNPPASNPPASTRPVSTRPGAADLPRPPRADEYYGLIQPTAGAPVHFQLVLPSRVSDFLARARGAHRSGLYYTGEPGARTAITPTADPIPGP